MNSEKHLQMYYHYLLFVFYLFKFRKFCNLLIFKTSPHILRSMYSRTIPSKGGMR